MNFSRGLRKIDITIFPQFGIPFQSLFFAFGHNIFTTEPTVEDNTSRIQLFRPRPDNISSDLNLGLKDRIVLFSVFFLEIEEYIQWFEIIGICDKASNDIMSQRPSLFRIIPVFPGALNTRSIRMLKDCIVDDNIPWLTRLNQLIDPIIIE